MKQTAGTFTIASYSAPTSQKEINKYPVNINGWYNLDETSFYI